MDVHWFLCTFCMSKYWLCVFVTLFVYQCKCKLASFLKTKPKQKLKLNKLCGLCAKLWLLVLKKWNFCCFYLFWCCFCLFVLFLFQLIDSFVFSYIANWLWVVRHSGIERHVHGHICGDITAWADISLRVISPQRYLWEIYVARDINERHLWRET